MVVFSPGPALYTTEQEEKKKKKQSKPAAQGAMSKRHMGAQGSVEGLPKTRNWD